MTCEVYGIAYDLILPITGLELYLCHDFFIDEMVRDNYVVLDKSLESYVPSDYGI